MNVKKHKGTRLLAKLLVVCMLLGLLPLSAFADSLPDIATNSTDNWEVLEDENTGHFTYKLINDLFLSEITIPAGAVCTIDVNSATLRTGYIELEADANLTITGTQGLSCSASGDSITIILRQNAQLTLQELVATNKVVISSPGSFTHVYLNDSYFGSDLGLSSIGTLHFQKHTYVNGTLKIGGNGKVKVELDAAAAAKEPLDSIVTATTPNINQERFGLSVLNANGGYWENVFPTVTPFDEDYKARHAPDRLLVGYEQMPPAPVHPKGLEFLGWAPYSNSVAPTVEPGEPLPGLSYGGSSASKYKYYAVWSEDQDINTIEDVTIEYTNAYGLERPSIYLDQEKKTLDLSLDITPATAEGYTVQWKNSDPELATLTDNGDGTATVTGLKAGYTTITAVVKDKYGNEKQDVRVVNVRESAVTVSLSQTKLKMKKGGSEVTLRLYVDSDIPLNSTHGAPRYVSWGLLGDSRAVGVTYDSRSINTSDTRLTAKVSPYDMGTGTVRGKVEIPHPLATGSPYMPECEVWVVTGDLTTHNVTFHDNYWNGTVGGDATVTSVLDGELAEYQNVPNAYGSHYRLVGWYTESDCVNKFDFSTPITSDLHLYAKWANSTTPTAADEGDTSGGNQGTVTPDDPNQGGVTSDDTDPDDASAVKHGIFVVNGAAAPSAAPGENNVYSLAKDTGVIALTAAQNYKVAENAADKFTVTMGSTSLTSKFTFKKTGDTTAALTPKEDTQVTDNIVISGVFEIPVTGVELDKETLSLQVNGTGTLKAAVTPDNATDKTVTWASSDEKIAAVTDNKDGTATVKAVKSGKATITVTTANGMTNTCAVTVTSGSSSGTGITTPAGSSSGTAGGGSGSGNATVGTTTVSMTASSTTSGTTAHASVTADAMNSTIQSAISRAATAGAALVVEINVTAAAGATSLNVELPAASLRTLAEASNASLVIKSDLVEVTLDNAALDALVDQVTGGAVTLEFAPVAAEALSAAQKAAVGSAPVIDLSLLSNGVDIHDYKTGKITATLPYTLPEGKTARDVVVFYLRDDGGLESCDTSYANGKVTFTANHLSKYVIGNASQASKTTFPDVAERAWYADAVAWAVANGITYGNDDGTFAPGRTCTRAEIVTFLWRAKGSPVVASSAAFSDVAANAYYAEAVKWAVASGVTFGTSGTTFSPNAPCTRAEAVTFLYRAEGSPAVTVSGSFNDVDAGAFYANAVTWAVNNGVTAGTGGSSFSPANPCTRAEIVTFLYRDLEE